MQNIRILNRDKIDLRKWTLLVEKFANGLPYSNIWYLDAVCDEWKIIIYKDYEAGFAFQIKTKFGLPYSLHPFLTQQLGFLGNDENIFKMFLDQIKKHVFYYHYQLHHFNHVNQANSQKKTNYELELSKDYQELYKKYKNNTKRNVRKASNNKIQISKSRNLSLSDTVFIQKYSKLPLKGKRWVKFKNLMDNAAKNNSLEIYKAKQSDNLLSIVIFIKNKIRAVYLMAVSNIEGQSLKANFLIVDTFIKDYAENLKILDFEGSNIEGIARFYAGFGASKTSYFVIKEPSLRNPFQKIFQSI